MIGSLLKLNLVILKFVEVSFYNLPTNKFS